MLDRGADIATVAKLAGHASVTTTAQMIAATRDQKKGSRVAALLILINSTPIDRKQSWPNCATCAPVTGYVIK
jgi:hypothetical protein